MAGVFRLLGAFFEPVTFVRSICGRGEGEEARPAIVGHGAGDVDLGNRRITVGGHVRPLDDLTHRAVLDRLDHRRSRWPNTANPHLLTPGRPPPNSARALLEQAAEHSTGPSPKELGPERGALKNDGHADSTGRA
ncbi:MULTISPECIES: hypothetical protein [Streptomyces]|uniref:Uncharacterized protein n=1 Tax=Streptomyces eurythermus TaxID=42237 RepID=A0ABW6Z2T1_9ACTN|nr:MULTISPECIES: hypothetical protein [Streptomyces]QIS68619.1 hypothetical protein HB370_05345 [Streptomyces sp. DSM 40868]